MTAFAYNKTSKIATVARCIGGSCHGKYNVISNPATGRRPRDYRLPI